MKKFLVIFFLRLKALGQAVEATVLRQGDARLNRRLRRRGLSGKYFAADVYLEQNADVKASGQDAFEHFIISGMNEGRDGRFFDCTWYLDAYPDVRSHGMDGYEHYLKYGKAERRDARYIIVQQESGARGRTNYGEWLRAYESQLKASDDFQKKALAGFAYKPKISILLPVYNPPIQFLDAAIRSVVDQSYENWELCVADDASTDTAVDELVRRYAENDARIKVVFRERNGHISEASNSALELATGDYIALLDHDDLLADQALFWVVDAINHYPRADIIYSDEDKIGANGRRFDPYFKSDFNYELFLAQNMLSHLTVYRAELVNKAGGFRKGFEGSQDHDLALRVLELTTSDHIHHIPRVLYHWRAIAGSTALDVGEKSYATQAGVRAVTDHLKRRGVAASVIVAYPKIGQYRVRYALPEIKPLVSLIIPTRDRLSLLKVCVDSILEKTTYEPYELIIVDNGSVEKATLAYFSTLPTDRVRIIRHDHPFNFSALNNLGVRNARGSYVVLMNNDLEVITSDWLQEMLSFGQHPDVGCVGARLWYPDKTLQHAGIILGLGGIAGHAHKHLDDASMGYFCRAAHHQTFSAVTGACLLVSKDIYNQVGGLDETLAVAFNDVDFCLKVRDAGYRNVWTPYAEMFHHESASRGEEDTAEKKARFRRETAIMEARWASQLESDPFYNPNLTRKHEDFSYAWPPPILHGR